MVAATIGWHSEFWLDDTRVVPAVLTKLACPDDIGFPGYDIEEVDVTCYDSPEGTRETIAGFKTPGDFEVNFVWEPGNETDLILRDAFTKRDNRNFKIAFGVVNGVPTQQATGICFVKGYDPSLPIDDNISLKITFKSASALTFAPYAPGTPPPAVQIIVIPTTLPNGTVGTAYDSQLSATGGTGPYSWSVSTGTLPAGLTLDPATGLLSGTPTTAGTSSFSITATDATGATGVNNYSVTIA